MKNQDIETAFLELLEKVAIKPLSNSFFERIEALKERAENKPHADLKAQYAIDVETCKTINGLEDWQLWQYRAKGSGKWIDFTIGSGIPFDCCDSNQYRRHPHADNIIFYHKCSEHDKKRWQVHTGYSDWQDDINPQWQEHWQYRLKPEIITINGKEYAAPLRVAPELGTKYFWYSSICGVKNDIWGNDPVDNQRLAANMVFATEQDCKAVADAFNAILRGYDND